ncbi:hypothetical protein NESM_000344100 [Novymonas esmeraldas]|uniref:Uncharacterized protein n=1 Tax=Novymonas esmeraldas TaxID=1808958 RepID=A0AAW0EMA6_9TRYP
MDTAVAPRSATPAPPLFRPRTATAPGTSTQALSLLLCEVLPYARFGLLRNHCVVSPPLALVAVAPQVRVYCEEVAPYFLGGTWWLSHVTTQCVVRCHRRRSGAPADTSGVELEEHEILLAAAAAPAPASSASSADSGDTAPADADCVECWAEEEVLLRAGNAAATVVGSAGEPPAEAFMARNSGTMALVPPQLSSNRRLLSYIRGVPPSFLSFCVQAAQQGGQAAARVFLRRHANADAVADHARVGGAGGSERASEAPGRLFVLHTQLYAICGCAESRIAYSAWWCLRRLACAAGPPSLPTAAMAAEHRLDYLPCHPVARDDRDNDDDDDDDSATVAVAVAAGRSGSKCVDEAATVSTHGSGALEGAVAPHGAAPSASLHRLRSAQQPAVLLEATRRFDQVHSSGSRAPYVTPRAWVTTAASLVVTSDLTFWSGTSAVDAVALLPRHWHSQLASVPPISVVGAPHLARGLPPPPPCALFLNGPVVLAVEHKLHRDAVHARLVAQEREARLRHGAPAALPPSGDAHAATSDSGVPREPAAAGEDSEEEDLERDLQPLFFDVGGDDSEKDNCGHESTSPPPVPRRSSTTATGATASAAAEVWYDPQEERLLDEIAQRQAFQLLHCVSVHHLRLPLGPELVAVRPTGSQAVEAEAEAGRWDARWLSCLCADLRTLDVEGPPSVSHAAAPSRAGAAVAGRAASIAVARQFRQVAVRPRGLTLQLGAAAAAALTWTGPLHTIDGLWRLRRLQRVVLRAYPFSALPALEAPPAAATAAAASPAPPSARAPCGRARVMTLSVMGWPYASDAGLSSVADAAAASDAPVRFTTLSLTHMDTVAFVNALLSLAPPPRRAVTPALSLAHLHQLELSKTRLTTEALVRMDLPRHAPQLRVLRLSSTSVDSVVSVFGLTRLRVLNVAGTPVTRSGLQLVQWMPALEELFLHQCESLCDGASTAENVFSLGCIPCPPIADAVAWGHEAAGRQPSPVQHRQWQPFAALLLLDMSGVRGLTQHALTATWVAGDATPVLSARVMRHSSGDEVAGPLTQPPRAAPPSSWMPQLHTLHLMHTAVSQLDFLLQLCPQLRFLDVSYTPLREDGLFAHVRCPRRLPLRSNASPHTTPDNGVYAVRFPPPLRLQLLSCAGTPLTTLLPLSHPPPLDWSYTTTTTTAAAAAAGSSSSVGRPACAAPAVPLVSPTSLCLRPHPSSLADADFEVHLRTQVSWLQHVRRHPHGPGAATSHSRRSRVSSASGYTIGVDEVEWRTACQRGSHGDGGSGQLFDMALQWTPAAGLRGGGAVRYGVLQLGSLRQLRLGHSAITAGGLAAGYGVAARGDEAVAAVADDGDGDSCDGLVELSLRGAPYLCPPYPADAPDPHHAAAAAAAPAAAAAHPLPAPQTMQEPLPPPPPPAAASTWSAQESLCWVLRRHCATLQVLDLAHTAVSLSTLFACADVRFSQAHSAVTDGSSSSSVHREVWQLPREATAHEAGDALDGEAWVERLTRGEEEQEAGPLLDALLHDPFAVLKSRVLTRHSAGPRCDATAAAPTGSVIRVPECLALRRWRAEEPRACVLGLRRLRHLGVEDTPLAASLRRLFPRLYHRLCPEPPHSDTAAVRGDLPAAAPRHTADADDDGDDDDTGESDAGDDVGETVAAAADVGRRERHARTRVYWAALLRDLFGEVCSVAY